jgi:LPS export ABC transporter protein LptC
MRTSEALRYARVSVAIAAGLAIVVLAVYALRIWEARQSNQTAPPAVPPTVQQRSAEFSFSKVEGDQTRFTVRASRATEFKEGGRSLLEDVWVTAFGAAGGRSDDLRTAACEYFAPAGKMECGGDVLIDLENAESPAPAAAMSVRTSKLAFDHATGVATSAEPVEFTFPQGEGRAVGLRYDSVIGELRLLSEVRLSLHSVGPSQISAVAAESASPVNLSSRELLFRRDDRLLRFSGAARAQRDEHELRAGEIVAELSDDMRVQRLVARDAPAYRTMTEGSPLTIEADELSAPLGLTGQPERLVAAGHVRMQANRSHQRRRLEASSSQLELAPDTQAPARLIAEGNVVASSVLPDGATRRLQAPTLEVHFDSPSNGGAQIRSATAPSGIIDWSVPAAAPRRPPEHMRLAGRHLNGIFSSGVLRELRGTGEVDVRRSIGNAPPSTSTSRDLLATIGADGLWARVDQTGDVRIKDPGGEARGDHASLIRQSGLVTLTGSVVLTDASSRTRAQSATFRRGAQELRAEGNIATSELPPPSAAGNAPFEPAHVTSERLTVDTARNRAIYSGEARLWRGESVIQADTIELDRSANVMVATGNVRAIFPQEPAPATQAGATPGDGGSARQFWQAHAGRMVYESGKQRSRLEGGARLESADGAMQAGRMDLFFDAPGQPPISSSSQVGSATRLEEAIGRQQLRRGEAFGAVKVNSGGRTATGERADYTAAEGKFVLSGGQPKLHDSLGNVTSGRQLTFFLADDRIVIDSEEGSRTLTVHRVQK